MSTCHHLTGRSILPAKSLKTCSFQWWWFFYYGVTITSLECTEKLRLVSEPTWLWMLHWTNGSWITLRTIFPLTISTWSQWGFFLPLWGCDLRARKTVGVHVCVCPTPILTSQKKCCNGPTTHPQWEEGIKIPSFSCPCPLVLCLQCVDSVSCSEAYQKDALPEDNSSSLCALHPNLFNHKWYSILLSFLLCIDLISPGMDAKISYLPSLVSLDIGSHLDSHCQSFFIRLVVGWCLLNKCFLKQHIWA